MKRLRISGLPALGLAGLLAVAVLSGCDEQPKKTEVRKLPASDDMFELKEPPPPPAVAAPTPPPPPTPGRLALSATALAFGTVHIGNSAERPVIVRNDGETALSVSDMAISGSGDFKISLPCALPKLSPGESCTIRLAFAPSAQAQATGELLIAHGRGIDRVQVSGVGTLLAPPPPPRDDLLVAARALRMLRLRAGPETILPAPDPVSVETEIEYGMDDKDYRRIGLRKQQTTYPVFRERVLTEDRYIPAVLENAINSQLPGRVIAVVEKHVYGSDGRKILFPAGTRFVGVYQSLAKQGDTRLNVIWERILRPDGASIIVEFEGADQMGRTGLVGQVDNRLWEKYGTAILVSALSAATAFAVPSGGTDSTSQNFATAQADLSQNLAQITAATIQQNINLAPVMTVAAGSRIEIIPTSDVWFREPTKTERAVSGGKVIAVASKGNAEALADERAAGTGSAKRASESIRKQAQQPQQPAPLPLGSRGTVPAYPSRGNTTLKK